MKRIMIAALAVLMAACQPMPASDGPTNLVDQAVVTTTRIPDCAARGGKMLPTAVAATEVAPKLLRRRETGEPGEALLGAALQGQVP